MNLQEGGMCYVTDYSVTVVARIETELQKAENIRFLSKYNNSTVCKLLITLSM